MILFIIFDIFTSSQWKVVADHFIAGFLGKQGFRTLVIGFAG
jgi:hypothetical protein